VSGPQPAPSQPPRPQWSATWARVLLGEKSLGLFSVFLKITANVWISYNSYLLSGNSE
jgi:hypothetical protein